MGNLQIFNDHMSFIVSGFHLRALGEQDSVVGLQTLVAREAFVTFVWILSLRYEWRRDERTRATGITLLQWDLCIGGVIISKGRWGWCLKWSICMELSEEWLVFESGWKLNIEEGGWWWVKLIKDWNNVCGYIRKVSECVRRCHTLIQHIDLNHKVNINNNNHHDDKTNVNFEWFIVLQGSFVFKL